MAKSKKQRKKEKRRNMFIKKVIKMIPKNPSIDGIPLRTYNKEHPWPNRCRKRRIQRLRLMFKELK